MRITENENLKEVIDSKVVVSGFDIHDKICESMPLARMMITSHMYESSRSRGNGNSATVKIYIYDNRTREIEAIVEEMGKDNVKNHTSVSNEVYRMLDEYIHAHINYINEYKTRFYTVEFSFV